MVKLVMEMDIKYLKENLAIVKEGKASPYIKRNFLHRLKEARQELAEQ